MAWTVAASQPRGVAARSWGNRATKKFAAGSRGRFPAELKPKVARILERLERGDAPAGRQADGYQIHRLTGDRKGAYAIAISDRYSVVFHIIEDSNAYHAEAADYLRN